MKTIIFLAILLTIIITGGIFLFYEKEGSEALNENVEKTAATTEEQPVTEGEHISDEELKDMIGQMIIAGFRGLEVSSSSYIVKASNDLNLGGVVFVDYDLPSKSYPRNIENASQVKKLIKDLQGFSKTPLFVAVDAEGGLINRLKPKYGFLEIPSPEQMGKGNVSETKKIAESLSKQLFELGFNFNFAPVVDVNVNPKNPIIGSLGRSFSSDPNKVTEHSIAFIEGMHQHSIITALKHFPGHGSSKDDSHLGMVDITNTYQEYELDPYKDIISKGLTDTIMTAHIINKNIDSDLPATLSAKFLQDLLRGQLGFKGVIISDDMQMGAIIKNYGFKEAIVKAVEAGCDLLIISNNVNFYDETAPYQAVDSIFKAVKVGAIKEERIVESYNRIIQLKKKFNIVKN
ncbi:MAG: glycoside hydrolase family 3 protein [Candidatus Pacebacteria bacterium]|nr:glycoside hydrolase family 3 protein [Candidatus Paceibacterota bacterium]